MYDIPATIIRADQRIDWLLKEVSFSRYLNPTNTDEARHQFFHHNISPPFKYNEMTQADQYLLFLEESIPIEEHPLTEFLQQKIQGLQLLIIAMRDRSADSFDRLAQYNHWYPTPEELDLDVPQQSMEFTSTVHSPQELINTLQTALNQRGLHDWSIEKDPVMSARVLVEGAKKILRVHPHAKFRSNDLKRLVIHEIDVHAMRSHCGEKQPLHCFSTGLPQSLLTEEGLAMLAEEKTGLLSPNSLQRQKDVVRAIHWGKDLGFQDLYAKLLENCTASLAWAICQRIKRGLRCPEEPGVYAKDSVYLRGWWTVKQWLLQGGNIDHLYVGKVGIHHPIAEWLEQGWLIPCKAPIFWTTESTLE